MMNKNCNIVLFVKKKLRSNVVNAYKNITVHLSIKKEIGLHIKSTVLGHNKN